MHNTIGMKACKSSSLCAHGYHPESQTLAVQFKSDGPVYHFTGVPQDLCAEFEKADSFGRFFAARIKGKFGEPNKVPAHPASA